MYVNNEVGAVQDIAAISAAVKEKKPDVIFHTDAIQAYGKYRICPKREGIDLLSASGHKFSGPKGSGFLYIRDKVRVLPIIYGGGQQKGMRSGTENVPVAPQPQYQQPQQPVAPQQQDTLLHPLLMRNGDSRPLHKPTTPLPSLDLLTPPPSEVEPVDTFALEQMARLVEARLADFRIKADVVNYSPGPVITRFELNLAPGVKAARISNLSRDLARSLSTVAVRVVEVIPGKPYVGLELPNKKRQTVYLREAAQPAVAAADIAAVAELVVAAADTAAAVQPVVAAAVQG